MRRLAALLLCACMLSGCQAAAEAPEAQTAPVSTTSTAASADPLETAAALSKAYGIQILVGEDAVKTEPWDYRFTPETDPRILTEALEELELRLSVYPTGMLPVLNEDCGGLHICIVKEILGNENNGSLAAARGLQFRDEENQYYLVLAEDITYTLYHELCHVIEDYLAPRIKTWGRWEQLNPPDFFYDWSYQANQLRDGSLWLQEGSRAFVDTYSMSFPREDRARIMEYAMTEGHEQLFESPIMQEKLALLSEGIREGFGLQDSPRVFLWEQYLK